MASTYTNNGGLERIGTGEQAGTWGSTTNTNLDLIDRLTNGVKKQLSIGGATVSSPEPLHTANGSESNGMYKVIEFTGTLTETGGVAITPITAQKLYFFKNATTGGHSIRIMQSTGSGFGTTVDIENTKTAIVYSDGAGNVSKIETGSDQFTENVTMKKSGGVSLTLQTDATAISNTNSLGRLQFQAPDETDGSPENTVVSTVETLAEADFTGGVNRTKLSFKTADGAAALERMKIGSENTTTKGGVVTITSGSTEVNTGHKVGALDFQAPLESDGGDGALVCARIEAQAESNFTSTSNNTMLVFRTGDTDDASGASFERFRMESNGSCGIAKDGSTTTNHLRVGASADLLLFHESNINKIVSGAGNFPIAIQSAAGQYMANFGVNGGVNLYYQNANRLETTSAGVTINGTLAANEVTASSDERLKTDIHTIDNALDKVMNMRGVSFTKQAEKGIGVIAQEIEKVLPEVVHDGEYKSVAYGNIVAVLIEAIKEQQNQIDELKKDK